MNQYGEYTKHYYAGDQRIASKIGTRSVLGNDLCNNIEGRFNVSKYELEQSEVYMDNKIFTDLSFITIPETWVGIDYNGIYICGLKGNGPHEYENELYFYHGDHLSSTQMITDIYGNVVQQVLYAPFGEVITEYNAFWHNGIIPDYMFNGKELDEENGMYYYSARYYNPPTFISRDPLFEVKPWMNPYAYCGNNPVNKIDPTGLFETESEAKAYKKENHIRGKVKYDGESWTIQDRKNKISIYRDNTNTPMTGKDENGIVTSPLVSAYAGRGGFRLKNRGGVGHPDETPKTHRDVVPIDITILWDWATEVGRILHEWLRKKENDPMPRPSTSTIPNEDVELPITGTTGSILYKPTVAKEGDPAYYGEAYKGSKDSIHQTEKIKKDPNRRYIGPLVNPLKK
jgi:RHS repeat-associated protein